jgi:hypothetical protein
MRPLLLVFVLASCGPEAPPCAPVPSGAEFSPPMRWPLDVLVVLGHSPTPEEHARRAAELARLLEIQVTGDLDEDGEQDFDPPEDIHLAVISASLGSGGAPIAGCEPYDTGDGAAPIAPIECGTSAYLTLRTDRGESPAALVDAFECVARFEPSCEIEQPLEAALRALSSPELDGFVREASTLTIVVMTTRDDCSASDPRLFSLAAPYEAASVEVACPFHEEALHPIERYVDGFLSARTRPGLLAFVPIAGIPEDLAPARGESPDFERLVSSDLALRDDRMEPAVDPLDPTRLRASCASPNGTGARPPLRLVRVLRGLYEHGADVTLESVCADRFEPVLLQGIPRGVIDCVYDLPPFPRRADGSAACTIEILLPPGVPCSDTPGAVPSGETEDGRARCVWTQLVPTAEDRAEDREPDGAGWFVDDYTDPARWECGVDPGATAERIVFTVRGTPGAQAWIRCDESEPPPSTTPCGACPEGLECDPVREVCGVPCRGDAHCALAHLNDHVCDDRWLADIDPERFDDDDRFYDFCVPRSCP